MPDQDDLEVQGTWWLPAAPDHQVHGTLTFSAEDGGRLSLIGRLRDPWSHGDRTDQDGVTSIEVSERAIELSGSYPRIHGGAGGYAFTLENCFRTSSKITHGTTGGSEQILVNQAVRGALFGADENLEAYAVSVDLENLARWVEETGIRESMVWFENEQVEDESTDQFRSELRGFEISPREVELGSGARVSLSHRLGVQGDSLEKRSLTQSFFWHISSAGEQNRPIDELLDLASDIQDLVSMALGRPSAFGSVRFWHPDIYRDTPDGQRHPIPLDFYARWNVKSSTSTKKIQHHDLLFSFHQIGGMDGVKCWMDAVASHRSGLGRVAGTLYANQMFATDRLLNCSAALEAFDRIETSYENSKFKTRLTRCVNLAGEPFATLVGDFAVWAEAVRVERDDVAHHLGRKSLADASETHTLWRSLFYLYVLCLLRKSDAPQEVFDHLQQHADYIWLAQRLTDQLASASA